MAAIAVTRCSRRFAETFRSRTREDWCRVFDGSDACFAPVLSWSEARAHAHSTARDAYAELGGVPQPAPAPRFSRTRTAVPQPPPERGQGERDALADWGFDAGEVKRLESLGLGTKD